MDRRSAPRHEVDWPGHLTIAGRSYTVRVADLSETGVRLTGAPTLHVGARGTLGIDRVGCSLPLSVLATDGEELSAAFDLDAKTTGSVRAALESLARAA